MKGRDLMDNSLEGKEVIIFGGAGKIGLPISMGLSKVGANVTIASRNATKLEIAKPKEEKINLKVLDLDATDEDAMRALFASGVKYNGCIFCSTIRPMTEFLNSDIEKWRLSVLHNSTSLYLSNLLAAEHMKSNKGGSIINVSSIYGIRAPDPNIYIGTEMGTEPDYPFLKGGMIALTNYMAVMYGKSGVRFNCIAPGGLEGDQPNIFKQRYRSKVPLDRMMQCSDLIGPVQFLLSDMSAYVTGCTIPIDGGFTL